MPEHLSSACPLCGRRTRAHSRITLEDVGSDGSIVRTGYTAVICRDCAFATVLRACAGADAAPGTPEEVAPA